MMNLPGQQAQTHLLFGRPVTYIRTPKRLNSTIGE
jgi:hypothetical protein